MKLKFLSCHFSNMMILYISANNYLWYIYFIVSFPTYLFIVEKISFSQLAFLRNILLKNKSILFQLSYGTFSKFIHYSIICVRQGMSFSGHLRQESEINKHDKTAVFLYISLLMQLVILTYEQNTIRYIIL